MRWGKGEDTIDLLLRRGELETITGAAASGASLLASAHGLIESAAREVRVNPEASYVLSYDAARKACTGLLAQQGLRARGQGHHTTVAQVVVAQFGGVFRQFGVMRRRRAEIEYPRYPGDDVPADEARAALADAGSIVDAAEKLMPSLPVFR